MEHMNLGDRFQTAIAYQYHKLKKIVKISIPLLGYVPLYTYKVYRSGFQRIKKFVFRPRVVAALRGKEEIRTADHSACLHEGRASVRKQRALRAEEDLVETLAGALVQGARRLRRATKTGAWLTVQPYTVNGKEKGAQEW